MLPNSSLKPTSPPLVEMRRQNPVQAMIEPVSGPGPLGGLAWALARQKTNERKCAPVDQARWWIRNPNRTQRPDTRDSTGLPRSLRGADRLLHRTNLDGKHRPSARDQFDDRGAALPGVSGQGLDQLIRRCEGEPIAYRMVSCCAQYCVASGHTLQWVVTPIFPGHFELASTLPGQQRD